MRNSINDQVTGHIMALLKLKVHFDYEILYFLKFDHKLHFLYFCEIPPTGCGWGLLAIAGQFYLAISIWDSDGLLHRVI